MDQLNIRQAGIEDIGEVVECLKVLSPFDGECSEDRYRYIWLSKEGRGHVTYVAVFGGRVVGTATVVADPKLTHGGCWCGRVEDVAVLKGFQGRGVGRALVEACQRFARRHRLRRLELSCSDDNVGFYEGLGFARHENSMRWNATA